MTGDPAAIRPAIRYTARNEYPEDRAQMSQTKHTQESMSRWVMRFDRMKEQGIPLMFIDSALPGHERMNYAVIGDTASENPDFAGKRQITAPHRYQIGMGWAPPGNGPAWHTHDYIESFFVLSGPWRFYWGNSEHADEAEGLFDLDAWDLISFPPGVYRSFEYMGTSIGWFFAVLESHEVFRGKDPYWAPEVEGAAAGIGFQADAQGKMRKPADYETRVAHQQERLLRLFQQRTGASLADYRPEPSP